MCVLETSEEDWMDAFQAGSARVAAASVACR
jgi:hypothetical protein